MPAAPSLWLALALSAVAAVPSVAEAGSRSHHRRPGGGFAPAPRRVDDLAAVVASTPTGGKTYLPRGIFRAALVIDRAMTLVAHPGGTTIDGTGLGLPGIRILSGVTDVTLEGVRIQQTGEDGVLAQGRNHRLQLRSMTFLGCGGDGARIVEAGGVVVDRCRFESNAGDAIDASGPTLRATRLVVRQNGGTGVVVRGRAGQVVDSTFEGGTEGVRFEGRQGVARRNAFLGVAVAARLAAGADTCFFERNDVRGGVSALLADPGSRYGTAAANDVRDVSGDAFGLSGSWHTVVSNDIARAAGAAVDADGSSHRIQGNDIRGAGAAGVSLRGTDNLIDSNVIADTAGPAVSLEGDGNVVALNRTTGGEEGIVLAGDRNLLQGNVLHGAAGNGIRIASGVANHIVANTIVGCGDRGFVDAGSGTVLERNRIE